LDDFKQISGIISIGLVEDIHDINGEIHIIHNEDQKFIQFMQELINISRERILELAIEQFTFELASEKIIGYREDDVLLVLVVDKKINKIYLKNKIDKFRNDLLLFT